MSEQTRPHPSAPQISEERYRALPPETQRRVGMAMQFLLDLHKLHAEGMEVATHLLHGKTPGADVGILLMDFERSLRIASNELLKHPYRVVHADALRKGETKLDDSAWLMRVRVAASEARKVREEKEREDRFHALSAPTVNAVPAEEPEPESGPRP